MRDVSVSVYAILPSVDLVYCYCNNTFNAQCSMLIHGERERYNDMIEVLTYVKWSECTHINCENVHHWRGSCSSSTTKRYQPVNFEFNFNSIEYHCTVSDWIAWVLSMNDHISRATIILATRQEHNRNKTNIRISSEERRNTHLTQQTNFGVFFFLSFVRCQKKTVFSSCSGLFACVLKFQI